MDLKSHYMGLEIKHPVIASASPLSESFSGIRKLEDGGAAAVVMSSLFEEQIRRRQQDSEPGADEGFASQFSSDPHDYLELIRRASESADIPIIASLNCVSMQGWSEYASYIEQAGASGIELNIFSVETDLDITAVQVEEHYLECLRIVKAAVSIPVAIKLSPFFSAIGNIAKRLDQAGASGLVLFNRFYRPDVDIDTLSIRPTLTLSNASEIRLPLQWVALLHGKINASLAGSCGVETSDEVIKYLLAGADCVMTTSALLRKGPSYTARLVEGLAQWMETHSFESIDAMRGIMSHARAADPLPLERVNYIRMLENYH